MNTSNTAKRVTLSFLVTALSLALSSTLLMQVDSSRASSTVAYEMSNLEIRLSPVEDTTVSPTSYKGFRDQLSGFVSPGLDITWTSDWYACDSKTAFKSTEASNAGDDVADETAIDALLTNASCTILPTSGTFNRVNTVQSTGPGTKYSFVDFDASGKQFVSLKVKGEATGRTTVFGVSHGFDRPEVATAPTASVSGTSIATSVATFNGDYQTQRNALYACDSQLPAATDQSRVTTETALSSNSCTAVNDENGFGNIPSSSDQAGTGGGPDPFVPIDLGGKYISMVSMLDSTVWEVSEGFLVPSTSTSTPTPPPYSGPIITDIGEDKLSTPYQTFGGQTVRVDGERLSTVNRVFVDGKEGVVLSAAEDHFIMTVPEGITAGTYDLVVNSALGNLTYLDGFVVSAESENVSAANAICDGVEPSWWTQRISDTEAKAYIKCPAVGQKYRILQQTGGSGEYTSIFAKTLTDENDTTQVFNEFGRYIVRTIDLEDINRIRIRVDDVELWKVRYNNPPTGVVTY